VKAIVGEAIRWQSKIRNSGEGLGCGFFVFLRPLKKIVHHNEQNSKIFRFVHCSQQNFTIFAW
jgi:hypothetical protein